MSDKVSPQEDATLRRLHWFEKFGAELSPALKVVKQQIWQRDKRATIRPPEDSSLNRQVQANRSI